MRKPWAETAAEVRAVIDEYAGRINQGRKNVKKLATSAELYGNASPETLGARAKTRDKVNAQTESNRKISQADKTVGSLLDIMQYEGRTNRLLTWWRRFWRPCTPVRFLV